MVAPLMAGDRAIGTLNLWREPPAAAFAMSSWPCWAARLSSEMTVLQRFLVEFRGH